MILEISLNNGINLTANGGNYNPESFVDLLNDRSVHSVKIGNYLWSRHAFAYILSHDDKGEESNIDIYLNNEKIVPLYVENYDGDETLSDMNQLQKQYVLIGKSIFNKNLVLGVEDKQNEE